MSAIETVNLISSLASLILAVLAIWLALHFYDKSKNSEKNTEVNVNEIKTQTANLMDISSRMLDKYTDYATKPKQADETFLIITQLLGQFTSANIGAYPQSGNTAQLEKYAVDVTIVGLFYAGLTNLALQDLLPDKSADIDADNNIPALLDGSKRDFVDLETRLASLDTEVLSASNISNLYQIASGWNGLGKIKDMSELYVSPVQGE